MNSFKCVKSYQLAIIRSNTVHLHSKINEKFQNSSQKCSGSYFPRSSLLEPLFCSAIVLHVCKKHIACLLLLFTCYENMPIQLMRIYLDSREKSQSNAGQSCNFHNLKYMYKLFCTDSFQYSYSKLGKLLCVALVCLYKM